jgi:hypothetical protein
MNLKLLKCASLQVEDLLDFPGETCDQPSQEVL